MIRRNKDPKDFVNLSYEDVYIWMLEFNIATWQEVDAIVAEKGETVDTLNSIIYERTGYEDLVAYVKWEDPY